MCTHTTSNLSTVDNSPRVIEFPLTNGGTFRVDADDADTVRSFAWWKQFTLAGDLAAIVTRVGRHAILLHRLLLCEPDGFVDHIDGDPSNNARSNLRVCTHAENMRNRKIARSNQSGFKGVYLDARRNKWRSEVRFDGRKYYCGTFDTPERAHEAYCKKAAELHGEFARFG